MSTAKALKNKFVPSEKTKWNFKRMWVNNREKILEFMRIKFHSYFVAIWMAFNIIFTFNSGIVVYISRFMHHPGDPVFLLQQIGITNQFLLDFSLLFFIPYDRWAWWDVAIFTYQILFVWLYSTVTVPIKRKNHKNLINFTTTTKGRITAAVLCVLPFVSVILGYAATKTDHVIWPWAKSVIAYGVDLKFDSMESFGMFILILPLFVLAWGMYLVFKIIYREEDVREIFLTWEFPPLAKLSFSLTGSDADIIVGWEDKTNKPIVLRQNDRMLHGLTLGPTGSGKTSTSLIIQVVQDMVRMAQGKKMGIVVLEPKGDFVRDCIGLAEKLGISHKIKLIDPEDLENTMLFNPLSGPDLTVAATFRGTFDSLAGQQDAFFKGQQNEATMMLALLAKARYDEQATMEHVRQMITDPRYLADIIEEMKNAIDNKESNPATTEKDLKKIKEYKKLVNYFEDEVINYVLTRTPKGMIPEFYPAGHRHAGKQKVENKKDGYISGVKQNINDLSMNPLVSELMTPVDGKELLDLDKFLAEGGILLVNTGMGSLDSLHKILGQFFIRQFQSAVFRRPLEGRIPVFLMVDEFSNYMNEGFADFVSLARSYKVGAWVAFQSIGQLDEVSQGYSTIILNSARNQMIYGGSGFADAEVFSNQFGEAYMVEESLNESTTPLAVPNASFGYRYNTMRKLAPRFTPTDLRELKLKEFVCQIVVDGTVRPPVKAKGRWIQETRFLKKFLNIGDMQFELNKKKGTDNDGQAAPVAENIVIPDTRTESPSSEQSEAKPMDMSNVVTPSVGQKIATAPEEAAPRDETLLAMSFDSVMPSRTKEPSNESVSNESETLPLGEEVDPASAMIDLPLGDEATPSTDSSTDTSQEESEDMDMFDDPTVAGFNEEPPAEAPSQEDFLSSMIKMDPSVKSGGRAEQKDHVQKPKNQSSNVSEPDEALLRQVQELSAKINGESPVVKDEVAPASKEQAKPRHEQPAGPNHQKKNKNRNKPKIDPTPKTDELTEEQVNKEQAEAQRKRDAKIEKQKKQKKLNINHIEDSYTEDI